MSLEPYNSHPLLLSLFDALAQNGIAYCLLRDGDRLDQFVTGGEVDLLVDRQQLPRLRQLVTGIGFFPLPAWGHRPHQFFLTYDKSGDCWLKLDIVTEIAYGRPIRALRTSLAEPCLARRQRHGPTYLPAPEDELVTLLLHCLLDKGRVSAERADRLQQLYHLAGDQQYLEQLVGQTFPPNMSWATLSPLIAAADWKGLLTLRTEIAAHLARRDALGTLRRSLTGAVLQRLNRYRGWLAPRPPLVALLAPDGAGKSTLSADLQRTIIFPVRPLYMGLYPRGDRLLLNRLPAGTRLIARFLVQWQHYLQARYYQMRRRWVIFDRYSYDALMPPLRPAGLLARARRWLLAHQLPAPDLIIILDAPAEILHQRKQEQTPAELERQRQFYLSLRHTLPNVVVVNAAREAPAVRREVTELMWSVFCGRLPARESGLGPTADWKADYL